MDIDQFLYDEFIAEANEHLLTIEEDFLALEQQGEEPDPELVDKVFRAVHSVKGGSAFLGLHNINALSHAMETLMSRMREGQITPESRYIEPLLKGVDRLSGMVADPTRSNEVDIGEVLERLTALAEDREPDFSHLEGAAQSAAAPGTEPAPEPEPEAPAAEALPESVLDLDPEGIKELLGDHDYVYLLRFDLTASGRDPAALVADLEDSGEIADAHVFLENDEPENGLPAGPLRLEALYATLFDPDMIEAVVECEEAVLLQELKGAFAAEAEADAAPPDEAAAEPAPPAQAEPMAQAAPTKAQAQAKADKPQVPATERGGGTIRINVSILDKLMTLAGELVLVRNQQLMSMERSDAANRDITQRLDIVTTELQGTIMRTRMQPIGNVLGKLPRIVRDLSMKLGKQITLDIKGNEVELDKTILESLTDPLTHIIRNCCDHGIEKPKERELAGKPPTGTVKVSAFHEAGQINIVIKDDGRGINPEKVGKSVVAKGLKSEADLAQMTDKEILNLIMLPGFSTAEQISDVSGRGVGMDVVKHSIEELGGSVELESWHGQGTSLHLRLPLTLAIIPCLIVKVDEHRFAIPQVNLVELVCLYDEEVHNKIEVAGIQEVYRLRDRLLPMVRLHEVLERPVPFTRDTKAGIAEKHRRRSARKLAEWEHRRAAERGRPEDGAKEDEAASADETAQAAQAAAGNGGQAGTSRMVQPVEDSASMETLNFAVVKVGADRFGLIVDQVLGTEEIVVKPLHPALKSLRCYSGATVMGDGAVSLILDIEGIARHAGVSLEQLSDEIVSQTAAGASRLDTQSILLFQSGRKEQFALALPLIRRIERIGMQQVEQVGQKEFITVDGVSTLVLRLDKFLSVSPCEERQEMFLILPKYCHQPFGILMSRIIDIEEAAVHLNTESYSEDGLLGTDIIRGHLTLFPDIYRLIEKAEPQWFADRKRMAPSDGKKRVLLLEDSSFMRLMVQKYLESDGYDVTPAEDGRQALERMHEKDFDIVVSDIEMPVMDGLEYIKNVRMGARQRDIPAIALTALNTDYDRDRALGYGFDGYQVKIDRERFLAEVARLLNTRHEPQVSHAD